tara:strand:+ start:461 stop:877 length:417 start_codon:yes stop_codon:yes gene_type:complete
MTTADLSTIFVIRVAQEAPGAEVITVANPGRGFIVEKVNVMWRQLDSRPSRTTVQIARMPPGGVPLNLFAASIVGSRTVVPVWLPAVSPQNITSLRPDVNTSFGADDNVRVTITGTGEVTIELVCIAGVGSLQSLVVT